MSLAAAVATEMATESPRGRGLQEKDAVAMTPMGQRTMAPHDLAEAKALLCVC